MVPRAGSTVLPLLAQPLCAPILRAHQVGPLRFPELRKRIGGASEATLRGQITKLRRIGALERRVRSGMPYTVENDLTDAGAALLQLAELVEAWLAHAPDGPIQLSSKRAKAAIGALVGGWSSEILHLLAPAPLSLTELNSAIPDLAYPSIKRRLLALRATRQVAVLAETKGFKFYAVTDWTRRAALPLLVAGGWEDAHLAEVAGRLSQPEVEAAFLFALPRVSLPETATGSCLIAFDASAGLQVEVENGSVEACAPVDEPDAATIVRGSTEAWIRAVIKSRPSGLRTDGSQPGLARMLVTALQEALRV